MFTEPRRLEQTRRPTGEALNTTLPIVPLNDEKLKNTRIALSGPLVPFELPDS
jgi:hypothetical protein